MLYQLKKFKNEVDFVLKLCRSNRNCPAPFRPQEWEMLNDFLLIFKPLETATHYLSGQKYCTYSFAVPVFNVLMAKMDQLRLDGLRHLQEELNLLKQAFNFRFSKFETNKSALIANLFDPRFEGPH